MSVLLRIPKELKIALVKKGITLRQWAEQKGYNYNTVFSVASGVIPANRKGTKSYKIKKELEKLMKSA